MHIDPTDPLRGVPEPTAATGKGGRPPDVSRDALLGSGVPAEVVDAVWRQEAERLRLTAADGSLSVRLAEGTYPTTSDGITTTWTPDGNVGREEGLRRSVWEAQTGRTLTYVHRSPGGLTPPADPADIPDRRRAVCWP